MSLLEQLSSQCGDRTEASNLKVAAHCLQDPALLDEIAEGLKSGNAALMGDCAEVMTKTATEQPALVAPYAPLLASIVQHANTRVRWESMHALALAAQAAPATIEDMLPQLARQYHSDKSVIVRDSIVILAANYAGINAAAAQQAYPLLKTALTAWDGKQAALALKGLQQVVQQQPELCPEITGLLTPFLDHAKPVVRKAARALQKPLRNAGQA